MSVDREQIYKFIYRAWKKKMVSGGVAHPDEEQLACFIEHKLSEEQSRALKTHLLSCSICASCVSTAIRTKEMGQLALPQGLLEKSRQLLGLNDQASFLELILSFSQGIWQIIRGNADILLGQEFIPVSVLRSRKVNDFKERLTILKDFEQLRVEIRLRGKERKRFGLEMAIKDKKTQKPLENLRAALIKDDLELESYPCDSGRVTFDDILAGKYRIEIRSFEGKLTCISLEIKG